MKRLFILAALSAVCLVPAFSAEYRAASAADVARWNGKVQPGDTLVLADGNWPDQVLAIGGHGTEAQPLTIRAQTPGRVIFTGRSGITIDGDYIVLSGITIKDGAGVDKVLETGIALKGSHCRLTESAVIGGTYLHLVRFWGIHQRMDHCYLAGKASGEPTFQLEVAPEQPNYDEIDHNDFGPRQPLGRNGGETMRVGYSFQSMFVSRATVEDNLFDRCDGELEVISSKSCENIYRRNTFLDCDGTLTLRHGNRCRVEDNFFLGHHLKGTGGIRIIGEDHVIAHNYFEGLERGVFWIYTGVKNSPLIGYFRAQRCVLDGNIVVDCQGPLLDLSTGMGGNHRTEMPENDSIINNVFAPAKAGPVLKDREGAGYRWSGNLVQAGSKDADHAGMQMADLKWTRGADGLQRLGAGAPAVSARLPVGRPLTKADVGPGWLVDRP